MDADPVAGAAVAPLPPLDPQAATLNAATSAITINFMPLPPPMLSARLIGPRSAGVHAATRARYPAKKGHAYIISGSCWFFFRMDQTIG